MATSWAISTLRRFLTVYTIVSCVLLSTSAFATENPSEPPATGEMVIPPGEEDVLLLMLGKGVTLPGDCKLSAGQVEKKIVLATYACSAGEVVLKLVHPDEAGSSDMRTKNFALSWKSGSPSPDFKKALESLILAHEDGVTWKLSGPPQGWFGGYWLGLLGLSMLGVGAVAWVFLRRKLLPLPPTA